MPSCFISTWAAESACPATARATLHSCISGQHAWPSRKEPGYQAAKQHFRVMLPWLMSVNSSPRALRWSVRSFARCSLSAAFAESLSAFCSALQQAVTSVAITVDFITVTVIHHAFRAATPVSSAPAYLDSLRFGSLTVQCTATHWRAERSAASQTRLQTCLACALNTSHRMTGF